MRLTSLLTLVALAFLGGDVRAAERRPNILLILADDLGYGHVGCYGQKKIATPNLDRLAAEGLRFTQFSSGACVCAPARSTLMTGLHTGRTAVRNNGLDRHLYDEDVTVAEVLKKAGYTTGGFGKWGLGRESTPGVAVNQGFDTWFGQYSQTHAHFHYPSFLMRNRERHPLPGNDGKRRGQYAPDVIHEQALQFITTHKDRPFFAYLAYTLPHVELVAPSAARQAYAGKWPVLRRADPRPGYLGSEDAYADFAGMVSHLDAQVGEVMALLKKLGIDDDTVVLFSSDNGPQPGAWADIFVDFFDGNGPFRGAKGSFHEGGLRVPLIVRWPGRIRPGVVSDHIGYFPDVMPTLAELAGAGDHLPKSLDGLSFAPTLLNKPSEQRRHPYLYWEAAGTKQEITQQAVRWGDWKAVRARAGAEWELYDLKTDLGEEKNVAASHPDVLRRIEAICREAHTPERHYGPAPKESAADYVKAEDAPAPVKKTYTYKTVDGLNIQVDVHRVDDQTVRPVVVWLHGGALIMGRRDSVPPPLRDLCRRENYVLVSFDYRLAPEAKLPAILEDVRDAFRWLREQGPQLLNIDADRVVVTGGSAGGYLTLMTGFAVTPRPRALVSYWGYGDVDGDWYTKPSNHYRTQIPLIGKVEAYKDVGGKVLTSTDGLNGEAQRGRSRFYHYLRQNGLWTREVTGFDPAKEPRKLDPYCPVRNVASDYPPTLLIHGTEDTDVPYDRSAAMAKELTRHKVAHELVTVRGAGHGLSGADKKVVDEAHEKALTFIRKYLP